MIKCENVLLAEGSGAEEEQKSDEKEAGDAPAADKQAAPAGQRGGRRGGASRGGYRGRPSRGSGGNRGSSRGGAGGYRGRGGSYRGRGLVLLAKNWQKTCSRINPFFSRGRGKGDAEPAKE